MESKITEEELKNFRSQNTKFIHAESELARVTAMIDRYEKKKLQSLMNYEMSLGQLENTQGDLDEKYNTENKTGFKVDLTDGSIKFM